MNRLTLPRLSLTRLGRGGAGDIIAPIITGVDIASSVLTAASSEAGTGYYVWDVSTTPIAGATAKTAALAASPAQTITIASGPNTGTVTGLPAPNGSYYLHLVAQDAAGNLGAFTVPSATAEVVLNQWDLSRMSFPGTAVSVSGKDTFPAGLYVSSDGTVLLLAGDSSNSIHRYTMSPGWSLASLTFAESLLISATDSAITDVYMSPDGTKLFWLGNSTDTVYMHTLPTPYSLVGALVLPTASFALPQDTGNTGLTFSPDGLSMFTSGSSSDRVNQYTLTVSLDITTASFTRNLSLTGIESTVHFVEFGNAGLALYIAGTGSQTIRRYDLPTAYNLTSAVLSAQTFSLSGITAIPFGFRWNQGTGAQAFMTDDTNNRIIELVVT